MELLRYGLWLLPLSGDDDNNNAHVMRLCEAEISQSLQSPGTHVSHLESTH